MQDLQPVEVGEQLAVSSSEPEDGDLLGSVQFMDAVSFCLHVEASFPCGLKVALEDGLCLSEGKGVCSLFALAARL